MHNIIATREDKNDFHEEYGGLAYFALYREAQSKWLEKLSESKDINIDKYTVAMVNISDGKMNIKYIDLNGNVTNEYSY